VCVVKPGKFADLVAVAGEPKLAIEVFKLNLLAYPESTDAHENLAEAYLADGQKDLARQYAERRWP
jgi:hypothetical protein